MALSLILFFLLMFIESNILFISTTDKTTGIFFAFLGKIKSFDGSDFISSLLIKYLKKDFSVEIERLIDEFFFQKQFH